MKNAIHFWTETLLYCLLVFALTYGVHWLFGWGSEPLWTIPLGLTVGRCIWKGIEVARGRKNGG